MQTMPDSSSASEGTQRRAPEVLILGGARTPSGRFIGPLKDFSAIDLGVIAARAAVWAQPRSIPPGSITWSL